jgi:membrane protein
MDSSHWQTIIDRARWVLKVHEPKLILRSKFFRVLHRIWLGWQLDSATDMAAEVSFYFVLSCFPFLMVLTALLALMHSISGWYSFSYWLTNYMPTSARDTVLSSMHELSKESGSFLSFGLLLTIWSASSGFLSLMDALSRIYGVKDERSYFKRRGIAITATLVAALFLLFCFWIWSEGHLLTGLLWPGLVPVDTQWRVARWLITLLTISFAVDLINYFLPKRHSRWRWVTPGSALTALSFVVASALLSIYVNQSQGMARIYGTLTGFIVMMLWIYLVNLSILLGAQTDAAVNALIGMGP